MLRTCVSFARSLDQSNFFLFRSSVCKLRSFYKIYFNCFSTTMAEKSLVLRLIASSVTVANRAGKIIRDIMSRGDLGIIDKGKNDLQTEADRSAQRCIIASLSLQFPNIKLIGEEGTSNTEVPSDWIVTDSDQEVLSLFCPQEYNNVKEEDIVIWVDPLDGTSEYTQGLLDHVTVLIGVCVKGKAVGGVIHQPYYNYKSENTENLGRTLWGIVNCGLGGFNVQPLPKNKLIVTTTRSHSSKLVQDAVDALNPDEIIRVGGAGHKVLLLLEGKAHAYVFASPGCKKWDICAPQAVLVAAGGKLTNIHGELYNYSADAPRPNKQGIFATAPRVQHEELRSKLPESVLEAML